MCGGSQAVLLFALHRRRKADQHTGNKSEVHSEQYPKPTFRNNAGVSAMAAHSLLLHASISPQVWLNVNGQIAPLSVRNPGPQKLQVGDEAWVEWTDNATINHNVFSGTHCPTVRQEAKVG